MPFTRNALVTALAISIISSPAGWAAPGHGTKSGQAHQDHGAAHASDLKFSSVGEAWAVLQGSLQNIQNLVVAKDLKAVHPEEEKISSAIKYLQTGSTMVAGDKAKRLESALRQAGTLSENVHVASDAGDQGKTESELKKLSAALKLVAVQYPEEALKAPAVTASSHSEHSDDHGHGGGKKEPTMKAMVTSAKPLTVGQKADVTIRLTKKDGSPVLLTDLEEAHTEKIHLLIIDPSLTDYHHEHPKPTGKPGEYAFSFTPRKPGPYRVWADLVPTSDQEQEYVIADLAAATTAEPISNRTGSLKATVDGYEYTLTFKDPLNAGDAILGTLTVKDAKGKVFSSLEPLMGAYAHIVGFSEDYKTIAHIHPMGEEPTKPTDRGMGELKFHLMPEHPGLVRLFAQVQIGGVSKFAPFTLNIKGNEAAKTADAHAKH